jgi:hypothetical protein
MPPPLQISFYFLILFAMTKTILGEGFSFFGDTLSVEDSFMVKRGVLVFFLPVAFLAVACQRPL